MPRSRERQKSPSGIYWYKYISRVFCAGYLLAPDTNNFVVRIIPPVQHFRVQSIMVEIICSRRCPVVMGVVAGLIAGTNSWFRAPLPYLFRERKRLSSTQSFMPCYASIDNESYLNWTRADTVYTAFDGRCQRCYGKAGLSIVMQLVEW